MLILGDRLCLPDGDGGVLLEVDQRCACGAQLFTHRGGNARVCPDCRRARRSLADRQKWDSSPEHRERKNAARMDRYYADLEREHQKGRDYYQANRQERLAKATARSRSKTASLPPKLCKECDGPLPSRRCTYCRQCKRELDEQREQTPRIRYTQAGRRPSRPGTRLRGYGTAHQKKRDEWAPRVDRGGVPCARCGHPIPPAGRGICGAVINGRQCVRNHNGWDLGHDDHDRERWTGPEHRCCNRGEPQRRKKAQAAAAKVEARQFSRSW